MDSAPSTSEIVESTNELDAELTMGERCQNQCRPKSGNKYSIEDDISCLFEPIDITTSSPISCFSNKIARDALRKSAMKRLVRVGSSHASGIGIPEPVSLKQAFRGFCISQASKMAAMKKRLSKPAGFSGVSEAVTIKRLYRAVVVETNGSGIPVNESKGNLVEISLVPEKITFDSSDKMPESLQVPKRGDFNQNSGHSDNATIEKGIITRLPSPGQIVPLVMQSESEVSKAELKKVNSIDSSCISLAAEEALEIGCSSIQVHVETPMPDKEPKGKLHAESSLSVSGAAVKVDSVRETPRLIKPVFRNKSFIRKRTKHESTSARSSYCFCNDYLSNDLGPSTSYSDSQTKKHASGNGRKEKIKVSPVSSSTNRCNEVNSSMMATNFKSAFSSDCNNRSKALLINADYRSRSREMGEFSQSSKSSIVEYSSSTTTSEESNISGSSRSSRRPHMSKDLRWEAIRSVQKEHGSLSLRHFKLLKKLGCGDIGTVYLAELTGTNCLFALKVMDNYFLLSRKKMRRAQTEKEIIQMLDHPFLPTLYAYFATGKLSCLVMEYCPGGDLHVLRQKQAGRSFSEQAARFYVAEVLALEYLHMLGVVYRDLKPENILVREDGHIMLTDFDLSLRCSVNPVLLKSTSPIAEPAEKMSSPCFESNCIEPFCLNPLFQVPCFTPRLLSLASKSRRIMSDLDTQGSPMPQLVVEPTSARSNSFVGTHEYVAPEIIKGEGHGSAVDWWTFGIFLFELLYGKTPFKGSGNDETSSNAVSHSLRFPHRPIVSFHARDLIRGLLVKEPENRLGSVKGAAEIKEHPFFEGLNWALIRGATQPEMARFCDTVIFVPTASFPKNYSSKGDEMQGIEDDMEFDMF